MKRGIDKKRDLPRADLKPLLEKAGLDADSVLFSREGDMTNDGAFCRCLVCFDGDSLYAAWFDEDVSPKKGFGKRAVPELTLRGLTAVPSAEISELRAERYLTTGRLIAVCGGEERPVTGFTFARLKQFDDFVKVYNDYRETGKVTPPREEEKKGVCKKCGRPCPEDKDFCKKHDKSGAVAVRLFKFFGGYLPQVTAVVLIMLLSSAVTVFAPQIGTRALFDNVISNPDGKPVEELIKALGTLVLSIFGLRLMNAVLTVIQQYVSATVMPGVMYDIKLRIFEAMQRLGLSFYSSKQTGSLMDRVVKDSNNVYWFFTDGLPRVIIDSSTIIGVFVISFMMNVKLSLMILVCVPVILIMLSAGTRFFRRLHHKVWVTTSKLDSAVSDNVRGQRVIKAFAKEDEELDNFASKSEYLRAAEVKLSLAESTIFPSIEIFGGILYALVLGAGAVMVMRKELTPGELLSFAVYVEMIKEPFSFFTWVSHWWARCRDSAQRIFEVCDAEPDVIEREDALSLDGLKGQIEINELEFEYEPARPVIKKLSLKVEAGEMLGIVGKTGAGKTTVANLIARLYDAKEGCVKIDGVDVKDLKLSELRRNVGLVSQEIYLFIGSIADNIRYARPDASMEEVIAAAKAACAHDFIMKLPDAYETRVGAGGQKLSGGERQRISIARTIIQDPKILILDEATAAMDTQTERNIQASLLDLKEGRTTIAIAHRLSTLRDSDSLAVIDDGRITEYGTYSELLRKKGEFYKQYKIQSEALKVMGIVDDGDARPKEED